MMVRRRKWEKVGSWKENLSWSRRHDVLVLLIRSCASLLLSCCSANGMLILIIMAALFPPPPLFLPAVTAAGGSGAAAGIDGIGKSFDYCHLTSSNLSIPDYFSPLHPHPYPNNTDCAKLLTAPADYIIQLDFRGRFNIEGRDCHLLRSTPPLRRPIECLCQYDFLEIRDGPYTYSPLIGRFCGRIFPPSIRSSGRYMRLRFKSDDAIQFDGFYSVYQYIPDPRRRKTAWNAWNSTDCHVVPDTNEGLVNSSMIPRRYINDATNRGVPLDCVFELSVRNDSQIMLRFSEVKLGNEKDCDMDFIDVHHSSLETQHRVKRYCGGPPDDARINASRAYLRFVTDPKALNENLFNGYYTALRPSEYCDSETEYDCGDGYCIAQKLECDNREHCPSRSDEVNCDRTFGWKKTTLQSVIISVVVCIVIIAVLSLALFLTCHERQISQPRRYFTPAPLRKTVANEEFGYGCTVDEMIARAKEEELGYFVRKVPTPIVTNIPVSKLVLAAEHQHLPLLHRHENGMPYTRSLPHNFSAAANHVDGDIGHTSRLLTRGASHSQGGVLANGRARSASPGGRPRKKLAVRFDDDQKLPDEYLDRNNINLHNSLKMGIPVFLYSPNSRRKLTRVA